MRFFNDFFSGNRHQVRDSSFWYCGLFHVILSSNTIKGIKDAAVKGWFQPGSRKQLGVYRIECPAKVRRETLQGIDYYKTPCTKRVSLKPALLEASATILMVWREVAPPPKSEVLMPRWDPYKLVWQILYDHTSTHELVYCRMILIRYMLDNSTTQLLQSSPQDRPIKKTKFQVPLR